MTSLGPLEEDEEDCNSGTVVPVVAAGVSVVVEEESGVGDVHVSDAACVVWHV